MNEPLVLKYSRSTGICYDMLKITFDNKITFEAFASFERQAAGERKRGPSRSSTEATHRFIPPSAAPASAPDVGRTRLGTATSAADTTHPEECLTWIQCCPTLSILDSSVPQDRQQCLLKATKEAKAYKPSQTTDDSELRDEKAAYNKAKERCRLVTSTPSEVQCLGQLIITFGKYNRKSLKWLVENDVGYIKYVLDRHVKESRHPDKRAINDRWIKDYLLRYVQLLPQVSCHLEMNVDRAIYGQGRFRTFTFFEMWQWYSLHKTLQADPQAGTDHERKMAQEAHCFVRQWLVFKEDDITTKSLKQFRQYILDREKPQQDTARPAATARPVATAASSTPHAATATSCTQRFPGRKTPRQDVVPPTATATSSSSGS